jgi:surfactin synthase thioesterase subunit
MTVSTAQTSAWIRRFHPAPAARTQLVCFPHAGGSASYFHPVSKALSPAVDVLAVQYPGRQDRRHEPMIDSVPALASAALAELRPWLDRPTAMFGHSMGAVVAFEIARQLEAEGMEVVGLFLSGRRAPIHRRQPTVHLLDDAGIVAELRTMEGTFGGMLDDPEVIRMIMPSVRNDYRAIETYVYVSGPSLRCPIQVFTGDNDPYGTVDEARDWAGHTDGAFSMKVYPGGHFYLNTHAADVIGRIRQQLDG